MVALLIVVIIACLIWLHYPLLKRRFEKSPRQPKTDIPNLSPKESSIMGKSTFVLRQPQPSKATESQPDKAGDKEPIFDPGEEKTKDAEVPKEQLDQSFSDTPEPNEPMDIEIPAEYESEEDPEDETEELEQILGSNGSADGLSYEQMDGANKTALADDPSDEAEQEAGEVFCQMESTDMFEQMISGKPKKEEKVRDLMAMHLKKYNDSMESTEGAKHDLSGFIKN